MQLRLALVLMLLLCAIGCARVALTMDKIQGIHIQQPYTAFVDCVGRKPLSTWTIDYRDRAYRIAKYPMQTGKATYMQYVHTPQGGYSLPQTIVTTDDFYFVFREDSLRCWGFLHELHRSDHDECRDLALEVQRLLDATNPSKGGRSQ